MHLEIDRLKSLNYLQPLATFLLLEILKYSLPIGQCLGGGKEVHLNHGEFAMLLLMASSPGRVFSKDQLYNAAWNQKCYYGTTAVENIIWRLRQKLEDDPKHPVYIKTVIRGGYKLEVPK